MDEIKINNTEKSAVDGKWKNPGASLYNELCDASNWKELLEEAYLIAPIDDIHNDPKMKTPFSRSGCKYPHHIVKDGKLVLSKSGVRAAYARLKQMGKYNGNAREHIEKHLKELGMMDKDGVHYEDTIQQNFFQIEMYLQEKTGFPFIEDFMSDEYSIKKTNNEYQLISNNGEWISRMGYYIYDDIPNFDWINIANVDTNEKYLRQGYATILLNELINDMHIQHPAMGLYLLVRAKNLPAIKLYEKCGFKILKTQASDNGEFYVMYLGDADINQLKNTNFMTESTNYLEEKSHGKLNYSFRMGINVDTGHLVKIVFDLNSDDVAFVGSHDDTHPVSDDKQEDIIKNIRKTGYTDFVSKAKVLAIVDMDTKERLSKVRASGVMSGLQSFASKPLKEREKMAADPYSKIRSWNWFVVGRREFEDENGNMSRLAKLSDGSYKSTKPAKVLDDLAKFQNDPLKYGRGYHKESIQESMEWINQFVNNEEFRENAATLANIQSPQSLSKWMSGIKPGYAAKRDNFYHDIDDKNFNPNDQSSLQPPKDIARSKKGSVYDKVELERYWFDNHGYEYAVLCLIMEKDVNDFIIHPFIVYQQGKSIYWFENSLPNVDGSIQFKRLDDLIKCVIKYVRKANDTTTKRIAVYYLSDPPKYGINKREYMRYVQTQIELPLNDLPAKLFSESADINNIEMSSLTESAELILEKSHGKLKFDYRRVIDAKTHHELLCIYNLKGVQITYPGHAWDINDFTGISDKDQDNESLKKANAEVQKNIAKKGNSDHQSYGQRLIAVKDLVTGKQWSADKNPGMEFEVKGFFTNSHKNPTFKIKLGEIETSENRTFKSTKIFKGDMDVLSKAEGRYKYIRGHEADKFYDEWAKDQVRSYIKTRVCRQFNANPFQTSMDAITKWNDNKVPVAINGVSKANSQKPIGDKYKITANDIENEISNWSERRKSGPLYDAMLKCINELKSSGLTESSNYFESVEYFEEKSHGSLKYCYRVGFDAATGEQVAVEFNLDSNAITAVSDPRLVDMTKETIAKSGKDIPDKTYDDMNAKASGELKSKIKKLGHIDFVTSELEVHSIFTKSGKKLNSVNLIPLFSDIVNKSINSLYQSGVMKHGIDSISKVITSKEFVKLLLNKVNYMKYQPEKYEVGKKGGNDKYKSTKLLWDVDMMLSYRYTPILRGMNAKGRGVDNADDAMNFIMNDMNNKFKKHKSFEEETIRYTPLDDLILEYSSWGEGYYEANFIGGEKSYQPRDQLTFGNLSIEDIYMGIMYNNPISEECVILDGSSDEYINGLREEANMLSEFKDYDSFDEGFMFEAEDNVDEENTQEESIPKQTDKKESDKNGVNRKKLYIAFIEWSKTFSDKNAFGSMFDKDAFHVTYPFVPEAMRYFYRIANPLMCILSGNLTFFQLSELRKINAKNSQLANMMIFAATENDMRVFNVKDGAVYMATEENGAIKLGAKLADSFDLYIQTMINRGDILNGADPDKVPDAPPDLSDEEDTSEDNTTEEDIMDEPVEDTQEDNPDSSEEPPSLEDNEETK